MTKHFVNKPCKNCPYCKDVEPFLRRDRGVELAYTAMNTANNFPCHETTEFDDEGEYVYSRKEKQCAGFLSLMHNELGCTPYDREGFKPSDRAYENRRQMIEAYQENGY